MLDIFNSDAFSVVALTDAINKLPFKPRRLGEIGLFTNRGVTSHTVAVEELNGALSILEHKPRGGPSQFAGAAKRKVRSFETYHFPLEDIIKPEDIQGVRRFGSEDEMETVVAAVNDRLEALRKRHEVTQEYLRAGAIQGSVVDGAANKTIDLFTEFNVGQSTVDFLLGTSTTEILTKCMDVIRLVEEALGDEPYDHVHAFCGRTFFDRLTTHAAVKYAFMNYREGEVLRSDSRKGFNFGGIIWEEYRGSIGNKPFIPADVARFVPVGVEGLFPMIYGPADFVETVNTVGLPFYGKQAPVEFDRGVKIHTQSNPLALCTRPAVCVKGNTSN